MSQEEKLLRAKKVIENSRYLVCLLGMRVSSQCGCTNWRSDQDAYDIETRYGCSPEEMFSAEFYNTRVTQFYDFYKREILSKRGRINEGESCRLSLPVISTPCRKGQDAKRSWRSTEAFTGMYVRNAERNTP